MVRDESPPVACNVTPKAYGGALSSGTYFDVVFLTSPTPPSGTCVTVVDMDAGGTCGSGILMSLWSGAFNTTLTNWPTTSTAGPATFQNDPGSSLSRSGTPVLHSPPRRQRLFHCAHHYGRAVFMHERQHDADVHLKQGPGLGISSGRVDLARWI